MTPLPKTRSASVTSLLDLSMSKNEEQSSNASLSTQPGIDGSEELGLFESLLTFLYDWAAQYSEFTVSVVIASIIVVVLLSFFTYLVFSPDTHIHSKEKSQDNNEGSLDDDVDLPSSQFHLSDLLSTQPLQQSLMPRDHTETTGAHTSLDTNTIANTMTNNSSEKFSSSAFLQSKSTHPSPKKPSNHNHVNSDLDPNQLSTNTMSSAASQSLIPSEVSIKSATESWTRDKNIEDQDQTVLTDHAKELKHQPFSILQKQEKHFSQKNRIETQNKKTQASDDESIHSNGTEYSIIEGQKKTPIPAESPFPTEQPKAVRAEQEETGFTNTAYQQSKDKEKEKVSYLSRDAQKPELSHEYLHLVQSADALMSYSESQEDELVLDQAMKIYQQAVKLITKDQHPLEWASVHLKLANALQGLGIQNNNEAKLLKQAIMAYNNCLAIYTEHNAPMYWAKAQMNLGKTLLILWDQDNDSAALKAAQECLNKAKLVMREQKQTHSAMTASSQRR